jgi:iron(II)-dependent oxidoreductase
MPSEILLKSPAALRSWARRIFRGPEAAPPSPIPARPAGTAHAISPFQPSDYIPRLIADGRAAFILLQEAAETVDDSAAAWAWAALERQMALVPSGVIPVVRCDGTTEPTALAAFFLDRGAVTNAQFACFVQAGGYDDLAIWPREVWPSLPRLTDRSGQPGPKFWDHGRFPAELADHPVVGICWYEAWAYARWVGKRLPTAAEWQKAGGWPEQFTATRCNRYPWGDVYKDGCANLRAAGLGRTAPVHAFHAGATPNGIAQMTGNVWEWLDDPLETIPCRPDESFQSADRLRRIIGGAFDTYFTSEATNQFITGQPELDRRANIGFRCALSLDRLRPLPSPAALPPI